MLIEANKKTEPNKKNILIIEDDLDFANFLKYLLEEANYNVKIASNSLEANKCLLKQRPDLITLDLVLPGETGIKLFRMIRSSQNWKDIPIIVITGVDSYTHKEISYKGFLKGVNLKPPEAYLEKPLEHDLLISTISKVLSAG